ncbi:DNA-processing protein DprA [Microbacterium sp. 2MCAF23]|uniref:DNA-processing protein DprA n=1 Tax=Microbacterium sp. 2MCAF23 TaxID=3232985 RepID=UPI003F959915
MEISEEVSARMVLAAVSEPGDRITGSVTARVGPIETLRLLRDPDAALPGVHGPQGELWRRRVTPRLQGDLSLWLMIRTNQLGLRVLAPGAAGWPSGLSDLGDAAPVALWARGNPELLTSSLSSRVAMIGARAATSYGEHAALEMASDLAREPRIVISGGAYGIDAAAHRGAVMSRPGSTVAVLCGGLDRLYPAGNKELLERIGEEGLIVSALPPGAAPTRSRFIERGRQLAAISGATVVVEAGYRSGTLLTASFAHDLGRPVGAVPGPITSAASAGCHRLLQDGTATVITNTGDITTLLDAGPGAVAFRRDAARQASHTIEMPDDSPLRTDTTARTL